MHEIHTIGTGINHPVDKLPEETECTNLLAIPDPLWMDVKDQHFSVALQYGHGAIICGGSSTHKNCQTWQAGDDVWSDMEKPMIFYHYLGTSVALGFKEVMVVGGSSANKVEVLQNGEWSEVKEYPITIKNQLLIAKTTTIVYAFGGSDGTHNRKEVYRYDRLADLWTPMADMPDEGFGFLIPVGARVT